MHISAFVMDESVDRDHDCPDVSPITILLLCDNFCPPIAHHFFFLPFTGYLFFSIQFFVRLTACQKYDHFMHALRNVSTFVLGNKCCFFFMRLTLYEKIDFSRSLRFHDFRIEAKIIFWLPELFIEQRS